MSTPTKPIFFWRREGDTLVRYRFDVSQDGSRMIIENEEPAQTTVTTPVPTAPGGGAQVKTHVDAQGVTHITGASPDYLKLLNLFNGRGECWFPGCENLLAEYKAEVEALGPGCPGCQVGAITRKYIGLANGFLQKK